MDENPLDEAHVDNESQGGAKRKMLRLKGIGETAWAGASELVVQNMNFTLGHMGNDKPFTSREQSNPVDAS